MLCLPQLLLGLWENFYLRGFLMKKKLLIFGSYVLVAVLSTLLTLGILHFEFGLLPSKLDQVEALIEEKFIGEADVDKLEDAAADAMVAATGDRWSYYMSAQDYESYREQMENAYVGVGITIQVTENDQGFAVIAVAAGGPAEEAGILVGDIVIEVAGADVRGMDTTQVRDLVKGEEGTFVQMTVLRQEESWTLSVERRKVQTPVATYELLENNVGLITIVNFDSRCADETIEAIETLLDNGAQKLIFDVRHNPGGYASELVEVLDYLLPEGDLFRTVRYDGVEHVDRSDAAYLDIPMAVLVNGSSYSAAEFFAAALEEYGAATVIGEPTTGKGYFQQTYRLDDGSAVSLSVGKYFTPNGISLADAGGLVPEHVIVLEEQEASALYYGMLEPKDDPHIRMAMEVLG